MKLGNVLRVVALIFCLTATPLIAQQHPPKKPLKPTEKVVVEYQKLVSSGALLTPEGWTRASNLFSKWTPYPKDSQITLIWPGYVGEDSVRGDKAEVESKWGDRDGSIDSKLRYHPPEVEVMTIFVYSLVYTEKVQWLGKDGRVVRESKVEPGWRIEGPFKNRVATARSVIPYLEKIAQETGDPVIKSNVEKTLKTLRHRTSGCGQSANAC